MGERGGKGDGAIQVDRMRESKAGTPTMGGLGIVAAVLAATLLWCDFAHPQPLLLVFTLVSFAALGFMDDRTKIFKGAEGLSKRTKMTIQISIGLICGIWFYQIDHGVIVHDIMPRLASDGSGYGWILERTATVQHALALPFLSLDWAWNIGVGVVVWTLFMTLACSNSVNFTDGMDGLAAGVMLIAVAAFMVMAYLASHFVAAHHLGIFMVLGAEEVAVFSAAIAGACLGFLWFNCHPAQVFMGDTGSQALGGALAMISICSKQEFPLLVVGFVFFLEGLSVALQVGYFKLSGGKRIFLCAPIHHHFQYKGWPETRIVQRFYVLAAITALLALASLKLR